MYIYQINSDKSPHKILDRQWEMFDFEDGSFYIELDDYICYEHRNYDLPAIVGLNGFKAWCKNGDHHRTGNKPAVIWSDGSKQYWVNDKKIK